MIKGLEVVNPQPFLFMCIKIDNGFFSVIERTGCGVKGGISFSCGSVNEKLLLI